MPREATFRSAALDDLFLQLEWASREALLRLLESAELFVREADLDRAYPVEFITWRLTGWKHDADEFVESVPGDALIADLVTMIQRLSRRCAMDMPSKQPPLLLDELITTLGVSRRSLARYRRHGLVMRYVKCSDGHLRLACQPDTLDWFRRSREAICSRATRTRPTVDREEVLRTAHRLDSGGGLADLAAELAQKFPERSAAAHRAMLRRAVERGDFPARQSGPLGGRACRVAVRANQRGIAPSRVAAHLGVGVPTLHRMLLRNRALRLETISSLFSNQGAIGVNDSSGLESSVFESGLPLWTASMHFEQVEPFEADTLAQDIRGLAAVLHRFHECVRSFPVQPPARLVDRAHTDLLWLTKLHWRIALRFQPLMQYAIEIWSGRPPMSLPLDAQRLYLHSGVHRVLDVLLHQMPVDEDRLESRVRAAVDRMLAEHEPPRADLAFVRVGQIARLPLASCMPHQDLLPDPRWEERVGILACEAQELVRSRWGLGGVRPRTLAEVAAGRGQSTAALARKWSAAQQALVRG